MTIVKYYPEEDKTYCGWINSAGKFIRDKGYYLNTHPSDGCGGEFCSIHNPSDHVMRDFPLNWRADRGLMERMCEHGVGHPDPDDLAWKASVMPPDAYTRYAWGVHGCDGCCQGGQYDVQ